MAAGRNSGSARFSGSFPATGNRWRLYEIGLEFGYPLTTWPHLETGSR